MIRFMKSFRSKKIGIGSLMNQKKTIYILLNYLKSLKKIINNRKTMAVCIF